ncbi:MAG: RNA polymerase factor sigma-54 [Paracoccaceae bacterium]
MSQGPRIQVIQTQRLQLNLGLQASIRMLKSTSAELARYLEEQAAENPNLQLTPPPLPALGDWLPRWTRVLPGAAVDLSEQMAGPGASLMGHVTSAIDRHMTNPKDRQIALALAEALEPTGWLGRPLTLVARELGLKVREVEAVLLRLQEIEPVGLFARDLAECLRLQAQDEGSYDTPMGVMLVHLDLMAAGDARRLSRLAGVSESEILRRFKLIRALNPKPGTEFDVLSVAHPREPDLIARALAAGGWEISLNRSCLPTMQIVESAAGSAAGVTAATSLQKMVAARNSTLQRVGHEILQRQQAALAKGSEALVPMTMADVALALGLHESTVSRVVAGTSVDTPRGVWWLRLMFSAAVGGQDGAPGIAAAALRDRLARLVAGEPPGAPLSDAALVAALGRDGVVLARRTVAKYREMLNIPPAHRRRRGK